MIIKVDEGGDRLDQFLSEYFTEFSRTKLARLIKGKSVNVNGKNTKASYIIKEDDKIEINLEELKIKPLQPENLDIEVIYKDNDIAIINKAQGIVSHPTHIIRSGTVVNFLLFCFSNKLPSFDGEDRLGIVHRLDKNTSGLMIIALSENAMKILKTMFMERKITKRYRAICHGYFDKPSGVIELPIGRNSNSRKMQVLDDGKYAKTAYRVLKEKNNFSYIDLDLYTGRTHQIRVHLSHLNHPILGDPDYSSLNSKYKIKKQLLQAYYLKFNHPITGKVLEVEIGESSLIEKYRKIIFD